MNDRKAGNVEWFSWLGPCPNPTDSTPQVIDGAVKCPLPGPPHKYGTMRQRAEFMLNPGLAQILVDESAGVDFSSHRIPPSSR